MRSLVCLLVAALILSGCQTADEAFTTNAAPTAISSPAASAIAGDMASRFAEQVGLTEAITIKMDKKTTEFAVALEAALKGWGYTVTTDEKAEKAAMMVELTHSIDEFEGQVLARLSTPSITLGRAYTSRPDGATPASSLSIMRQN